MLGAQAPANLKKAIPLAETGRHATILAPHYSEKVYRNAA
jgi:hypothetical protein